MNFLELVASGKEEPESFPRYWMQFEIDPEGKTAEEYFGVTEEELSSVRNGEHSFRFIALRYIKRKHLLRNVFPGTYVQFIVEYEPGCVRPEYGWVDAFDKKTRIVTIQCDDSNFGNRAIDISLEDVIRVLPSKERPNIFFKAMLCQDCRNCPHESSEFSEGCPFFQLFLDIRENRRGNMKVLNQHLGFNKIGNLKPEEVKNEELCGQACRAKGGSCSSDAKQNDLSAES